MDFLNIAEDVVQEDEKDVLGGRKIYDSNVYSFTIKTAYFDKSKRGANNLNVLLTDADENTYKHIEYITNAKGDNFYIDKKSGKKRKMPGMTKMDGLCELIQGVTLGKAEVESKVHNIYNYETSTEVPTPKMTLIDWAGKKVQVGMMRVLENKSVKTTIDGLDKYVPVAETREINEITKWFDLSGKTLKEGKADSKAEFIKEWLKANKGIVRDKTDKSVAKTGAPMGAANTTTALDFDS